LKRGPNKDIGPKGIFEVGLVKAKGYLMEINPCGSKKQQVSRLSSFILKPS
jgi:hypothetical protein